MLADFHFLRPVWLWALPLLAALIVLLAFRKLGPGSWQRVVDPSLVPHVLSRSATRGSDHRWWLAALAGIIAILALAGPAWQRVEQPVYRTDQALVIALDLSRSMDAQDVAPSRLMRARLKILDILEKRGGGQTALVVYSANAFTVTPLTTDTDTIAALVNSLSTDIMPSRGSYPSTAIAKGRALLEQAGAAVGEILLVTDGGYSPAAERAARELRNTGYTLSILGVGTREGAPIPRLSGGFVTDQSGQIAVPRLEAEPLRGMAEAGGGRFALLSADDRDIESLLSGAAGPRSASDDSLETDQWREEGPWLVLLLLPLGALAFRRGWIMLVVLAVLPLARPAQASLWEDLWYTRDQQAERRLQAGEPDEAAALFKDPDWQAVAQYRAGDYAASAHNFAESEDTRSLYNLGNALARQGELESAIDAYEEVLERDPDYEDARYNRDLLQQAQQQQQQQQQGDQQQSADQQGEGQQQSEPGDESEQESSEQSGQSDSQQDSDASQREQEASQEDLEALQEELQRAAEEAERNQEQVAQQMTPEELEALRRQQEQQEAMEQWLRRIPNDPGGLLRRKFRYQYQKTGKDQDGQDTWPDDEVQPW